MGKKGGLSCATRGDLPEKRRAAKVTVGSDKPKFHTGKKGSLSCATRSDLPEKKGAQQKLSRVGQAEVQYCLGQNKLLGREPSPVGLSKPPEKS